MSVGPPYRAALRLHICKVPVEITPEVLRWRVHFDEGGGASRRVRYDRGPRRGRGTAGPGRPRAEENRPPQGRRRRLSHPHRPAPDQAAPAGQEDLGQPTRRRREPPVAGRYLTFGNSRPGQIGHTPGAEEHGGADRRLTDGEAGPGALARVRLGRVEPVSSSRPWRGVPSP
jgi:hypothetical protein